ncbi:MAG: heavy metal translocating P-type ATPase metal-binding domain-containing protein [Cyclobacteriaceae bacterium]
MDGTLIVSSADVAAPAGCSHCGDPLPADPIRDSEEERAFCCEGCHTVYDILHDAGLQDFYTMDRNAGKKIEDKHGERWAFLDLPEVEEKVLDFTDGASSRATLYLPGIHCSSCIWLLEHLHRLNPAIKHVQVDFPKRKAAILWDSRNLPVRKLAELLSRIGYAPDIRLDNAGRDKAPSKDRSLVLKLGVAGFCFGNIMLLSLPEYLDSNSLLESNYRQYFLGLNLLLSLPVLLFSASPFYQSAFTGLRHRYINMDVPIALGISVLFGRSLYEIVSATGTGFLDSLAGLVFFLLIGRWYQGKTYRALSFNREYESYFPVASTVISDGQERTTLLKDLQQGDRLLIRHGELIPADSVLLKGEGRIDYAFVTGESEPQKRNTGDKLYAGGRQTGGPLEITLTAEVAQSYLTGLWNRQEGKATGVLGNMASRMGFYFTLFILVLASAAAIGWYIHDASRMWEVVTAVLIVACPCALALAVPFTYGSTLRMFGRLGLYLKNADTVESLAAVDTLVYDKTGTITHAGQGELADHFEGNARQRAAVTALCRNSTHPLSQQIYACLKSTVADLPTVKQYFEIPGKGITGKVEGTNYTIGSAAFTGNTPLEGTAVFVTINRKPSGYFSFASHFRSGLFASLLKLKQKFELHLLSGDNERDGKKLSAYFTALHFHQKPAGKHKYVSALQEKGATVMMLGDGLNDAGALRESHVGVSVSDDVYQFSPACDAILDAEKLKNLPGLLGLARYSRKVVYAAFGLSFAYNAIGIGFALAGLLTPLVSAILMPLSSLTVVAFCTLAISSCSVK